ncbi:hypothetical protein WJX77_000825 [Trebouxia sp. C0004]
MKITKKDMTDAGMSHADANAIMAEVESIQGTLDRFGGHGQDGQTLGLGCAHFGSYLGSSDDQQRHPKC